MVLLCLQLVSIECVFSNRKLPQRIQPPLTVEANATALRTLILRLLGPKAILQNIYIYIYIYTYIHTYVFPFGLI